MQATVAALKQQGKPRKPAAAGYQWTPGRIVLLIVGLAGLAFLFWYFSANGGVLRSLF